MIILVYELFVFSTPVFSQAIDLKPVCPKILGIAHVAYYSDNFEIEKQFYGSGLGFANYPSRINKNGVEDMIKYKVGNKQSIELFIEKKAEDRRFYHYAVFVSDSELMRQYLASKELKVPKDTIRNFQNYFAYDYNNMICEMIDIRKYGSADKETQPAGIAYHIDCVGFVVPNMQNALMFYIDLLGCKEISRTTDKNILKVKLQLQDSPDTIELTEYQQKNEMPDYGYFDYYSMLTFSVDKAINQLKSNNIKVNIPGNSNIKKIELNDINGTRIQMHK